MLTKKQAALLRMSSRKCGMSYRAACARNIEQALLFKKQGFLRLSNNGKDKGRFVFWLTEAGKKALYEYENRAAAPVSAKEE